MAEDFKALIEAQKETTRLLMTAEQRAEMDAAIAESQHREQIQNENRIEGGRRAWQTRQANAELSAGGAAAKEDQQEQAASDKKNQGLLGKIAGGVTGMFGHMMKPIKSVGKGIMAMLKGTLVAGLLLAVLAFLESPYWIQTKDFIVNKVVPVLETLWQFLKDNWEPIAIAFAAIGVAIVAFKVAIIGAKIVGVIQGIVAGFLAVKTFFAATLLPAVTGFMIPLLPIIAIVAAVSLALYALWSAFEDAEKTFEETGSIGEALKVGIAKFMGTILGFIPAMILKLVGWVAGLFGFDDFKKKVDAIDPIQWISDTIKGMFDKIEVWFTDLWSWGESTGATIDGGWSLTIFITSVWGSVVEWFKGLWAWGKKAGATEEGGFSLKKFVDAAFTKAKDWVVSLFTWATDPAGESWIQKTVTAVVTKVQEWALSLFAWAETPGGSWITVKIKEVIKLVQAWVTGLFSWGKKAGATEEGGWSLSTFISGVWTKVKTWFTNLFSWASTENDKDSFVVKTIKTAVDAVKTWLGNMFNFSSTDKAIASAFNAVTFLPNLILTGLREVSKWLLSLFGFDTAAQAVANTDKWTIGSMIVGVFKSVKKWLFGIFGFGTDEDGKDKAINVEEAKGFSLATMISNVVKKIKEYFWHPDGKSGILQFDFADALPNFEMPDLGKAIGQMLTGIFPDDWILGKGFVGTAINAVMPNSLLDLLKNLKGLATGGALNAGQPTMVGELGPELIMPSSGGHVMNAQRTAQIQSAGLQRGAGAGGGGPAVVNAPVNTVNNSQSNTTVTSTELKHPSAILASVNIAA
jgi:hypothetical protein